MITIYLYNIHRNGLTTVESKRRGVAPIIATLLMVAIAVVGGILIFVFTQGFFSDSQVTGPTVDNIRIFGYDARNLATDNMEGHIDGLTIDACSNNTAGNDLAVGDCIAIYVTNLGDKATAIQSVRIFGENHNIGATGADADSCTATAKSFNIMDAPSGALAQASVINPNTDVTICVVYGGASDIKQGRTIPVQVQTANGQSSQINIINGAQRGQN